jgi:hypothetical protein
MEGTEETGNGGDLRNREWRGLKKQGIEGTEETTGGKELKNLWAYSLPIRATYFLLQ